MTGVEDLLSLDEPAEMFRKNLVARIGAFALDHPEEEVSFRNLFPDLLAAVKADFFEQRKERVREVLEAILRSTDGGEDDLSAEDRAQVETVRVNMAERGYCDSCLRDVASFLHPRLQ
jgi:hypothetical protein